MLTAGLLIQTGLLLLGSTPTVGVASQPERVAKIAIIDLEVSGISQAATTAEVRRRLGDAQKIEPPSSPSEGPSWTYSDLVFTFDASGKRLMAVLGGPSRATHRGLRVGQTTKQALALYGRPSVQDDGHLLWEVGEDPDHTLGMTVLVSKGVISSILLGEVIEY